MLNWKQCALYHLLCSSGHSRYMTICQHTSTWYLMVTASLVCWLIAGTIIEELFNEVLISCGFSSSRIHQNTLQHNNKTDFCHHFSETIFVSMPEYACSAG